MKLLIIPITTILLLSVGGCSRSPEVSFGEIEADGVAETNQIEYSIGNIYGYRINFGSNRGKIVLREEFILPGPAPWDLAGLEGSIPKAEPEISEDGSNMVEEIEVDLSDGNLVTKEYEIIEGDPTGLHTIKLWVNDEPLETIQFTIE